MAPYRKALLKLAITLFLLPLVARSQQTSTAAHIRYGASLPATCKPSTGDIFFKTTATIGGYQCLTANTWTAMGGAAPAAPTFADITSGTNTSAAMVAGTGASLAASGSGTIAATSVTGLSGLTTGQLVKASGAAALANVVSLKEVGTGATAVLSVNNPSGSGITNMYVSPGASQSNNPQFTVQYSSTANDTIDIGTSSSGFITGTTNSVGIVWRLVTDNGGGTGDSELRMGSGFILGFNSGRGIQSGSIDTGISRSGAGVVAIGTGAQGSVAGTLSTTNLTLAGSAVTLSGLGNATGTPSSLCQNTNTVVRNAALTCTVSSERVKNSFGTIPTVDFMAIRPMQFEYNDVPGRVRWGFGANQVASVNPALADGWRDDGEPWSLDQNAILALTVKTVQELRAEIIELKSRLAAK